MKTLLFYHSTGNLNLAKRYLEINGITRLTLCPSVEKGFRATVWAGGEDGNGRPEQYTKRNDAKRDLAKLSAWEGLNLPQYCEKKDGRVCLVSA